MFNDVGDVATIGRFYLYVIRFGIGLLGVSDVRMILRRIVLMFVDGLWRGGISLLGMKVNKLALLMIVMLMLMLLMVMMMMVIFMMPHCRLLITLRIIRLLLTS